MNLLANSPKPDSQLHHMQWGNTSGFGEDIPARLNRRHLHGSMVTVQASRPTPSQSPELGTGPVDVGSLQTIRQFDKGSAQQLLPALH